MPDERNVTDLRARFAPSVDMLRDSFTTLFIEAEGLLELARQEHRRIQDCDAELEAGAAGEFVGSVQAQRHAAAHRLRWIARRFARAHALLVPPGDERHAAAQRVLGWLDDAERGDAPWRTIPAANDAPEAA